MKTTATAPAPLAGVQVVVTRPEAPDGPLGRQLRERGATVLHWPVLRFEPPTDRSALDLALRRLGEYDGVVFTSPRAVAAVCARLAPPDGRPWVAAVGEATRAALGRAGWQADTVPAKASSGAVARELAGIVRAGSRVLFPASSIAGDGLPRALRRLGATVDRVTAYETVPNESLDAAACLEGAAKSGHTVLTFASPSAVAGLRRALGAGAFASLLADCPAAAIGATTAAALRQVGVRPAAIAASSTMAGLAEAAAAAARSREDA